MTQKQVAERGAEERRRARETARSREVSREEVKALHDKALADAAEEAARMERQHDWEVVKLSMWLRLRRRSKFLALFLLEWLSDETRHKMQRTQELEEIRINTEIMVRLRQMEREIEEEMKREFQKAETQAAGSQGSMGGHAEAQGALQQES